MTIGDRLSQTLRLPDGRQFGFAEWGSPHGAPLLVIIGGSSRLVHPPVELPGLRLITVDRPGLGLSDFHPGRCLVDFPQDLTQLQDALGLGRLAVVGISQGGPLALACACVIPDRLTAVSVVSSLPPPDIFDQPGAAAGSTARFARPARNAPWVIRLQHVLAAGMVRLSPRWTFQQVLKSLPTPDRAVFDAYPTLNEMFVTDLIETYRQGGRGSAQEGLLAYRPWGFSLDAIGIPVYLWHGEADQTVPVTMARHLAVALPTAQATYIPNEGHFLGLKCWDRIVAQLSQAARPAS